MTTQEAVEALKYMISDDCTDTQVDFIEEIEMAINALEKQIPKKPVNHKGTTYFYCPCCDSNHINQYCADCGQALDWGDTE